MSSDFPISSHAVHSKLLGQKNGWVRRFDASFNALYSTYYGGSSSDGCLGIAGDSAGNAYIVGYSYSSDLITTANGFQDRSSQLSDDVEDGLSSQFYFSSSIPDREAYVAEISADGTQVLYGSYLGDYLPVGASPPLTLATGIALSASGALYVAGESYTANFPTTDGGLVKGSLPEVSGFLVAFASSNLYVTSPTLCRIAHPVPHTSTPSRPPAACPPIPGRSSDHSCRTASL